LQKLRLQHLQELCVICSRFTSLLLGLAIDDEGIDDRNIDKAQEDGLVVLFEAHGELQRIALQPQLVVDIHPTCNGPKTTDTLAFAVVLRKRCLGRLAKTRGIISKIDSE
jgi:hypothetical protein